MATNKTCINHFDEIELLGTKFHKVKVQELINFIVKSASIDKKTLVGNVNVRAMNFACEMPWYKDFINRSDLVFCDGYGVLLGAKMCGCGISSEHRMTCPDYIEELALTCERDNVSLYLLAGKPGVVDKAIDKLKFIAPDLKVKGHHGYFHKTGTENEYVVNEINQFQPDILYVGFGMPVQERWIIDNFDQINAKVFLPLGACLDFYTGAVYRGPRWMTNSGLEWLSRMFTEPKRLWQRYIVGNPLFFYRLFKERFTKRFNKSSKPSSTY
ncbi:exopolysaccharide biosynthesis protein, WecB/TagA/CpsF family [Rivularia sp. PCC 7116]|uniref:WecB/TagA/CpsF family glycosyltransferase n=1 Tax=Rivularia sp. PCC 7116 TaxID=373994 RepID=UPI00029F4E0F|nr:WecB/TagA/CpsF family glycosyltransferase [Rivularia sp. PCC 7116]AFY58146.1 exopolysaccharide biosynthesis protein, WecB/TagA/CpsF family [Rivularia sp. PCC 7116]